MTTDISVGVRWDPLNGQPDGNGQIEDYDFEYDGGNSSSRLFERSRIRALAGEFDFTYLTFDQPLHTFQLSTICKGHPMLIGRCQMGTF